jgi:DNA-binding transcriptional MerR regulator
MLKICIEILISKVFIDSILSICYIILNEVIHMSDKLLSKVELQKRSKINNEKFQFFLDHKILEDNEIYTEDDLNNLKEFRKMFPLDLNDVSKKFKIDKDQINRFRSLELIKGSHYFSLADLDIFASWQKLKRLGYSDDACFKVLDEVGVPREDNLFEDKTLIQLKELSETTGIPERTIKFYEKEKLILKPRIYKNKRFYEIAIIKDLALLRDMQNIGYKLSTIADLLKGLKEDKQNKDVIIKEINEKINIARAIIKQMEVL